MPDQDVDGRVASLVARLRRHGTDSTSVEVKAAAGGLPKSTGETLSAFANGDGGVLLLGLAESDGFRPAAGFDAAAVRDALARLCSDDMEPAIRSDVELASFEGASVVVLEVPPLDPLRRPSYVTRKGAYEGSFIRGGDGDRHLTAYEVTQLLSNRGQPQDDAEAVGSATLDDLDPDRTRAFLARLQSRPTRAFAGLEADLALRRAGVVAMSADGTLRPTLAGLLCLGTYPQQFFPQLFVSFVALPTRTLGESLPDGTRFLDNVTCDGALPEMLDGLIAAVRRNMRTAAVVREAGREDRHDYPVEVIRELVVNALLHRDYSPLARGTHVQVELYPDRFVVKSPGGLFGNVVPSQLGIEEVSSTRNAVLAKLLADTPGSDGLPVSENRGSGLPRVMTRLRQAGMSPPAFEVTPGHVHVTVPQHALLDPATVEWIAGLSQPGLTDAQNLALALIRTTGSVSNEMLRAWGVESHTATAALRDLVDRGLTLKFGGRRYATYELQDGENPHGLPLFSEPPKEKGTRARVSRKANELQAVLEAVRAGHNTVQLVCEQLALTYATANRRVNALLDGGRLRATAPPGSRNRAFVVVDQ